jgi:hypothetical protein
MMPIGQQEMLINILRRRYIGQRRAEMALAAQASITDAHTGQLQPQPLDAILQSLRQS